MSATCELCKGEVEAHRYVRAEPLEEAEVRPGRTMLRLIDGGPYRDAPKGFYHLAHGIEAIEEDVAKRFPPSPTLPVRLHWTPAPGVVVKNSGPVTERRTRDGSPGLRSVIAHTLDELHVAVTALVPPGTEWYIAHAGATPDEVKKTVRSLPENIRRQLLDELAAEESRGKKK